MNTDSAFFLIWTSPQKAMQKVLATHPFYLTFCLAFASCLDRLLFKANQASLGVHYHYNAILAACIGLAVIYAFIWIYVFGGLLHIIGKLFGGSAPVSHVRQALVWAGAPQLLSLCVWFALLLFFPNYTFVKMPQSVSLLFLYMIMLIPSVWSLVLAIMNVKEVQNFSIGCAIGNWVVFFLFFLFIQEISFTIWAYFLTFI